MREVSVERETLETLVRIRLNLDGNGYAKASTGLGFFDHMLETLIFYASFDASVEAEEKRPVGGHHVIEDVGLALGEAIRGALGGTPYARFGEAVTPMDEALVMVAVDISGRPRSVIDLPSGSVGGVALEDLAHFIESLSATLRASIHVLTLRGGNKHHVVEAAFKGLGRALRMATRPSERLESVKGSL